jgi:hypothetical protein
MTYKFNHEKHRHRGKRSLSTRDEIEFRNDDRAARWLSKAEKNLKRFQKVGKPAPVDAGAGQQRRTEVLDKTSVAIDEFESKPEAEEKTCEQCRQPFTPRASSGGKAQRFCSSDCRTAFHNAGSQRVPVTPTYGEPSTKLPHVGNTVATTLAEHLAARAAEEARVSAFGRRISWYAISQQLPSISTLRTVSPFASIGSGTRTRTHSSPLAGKT